MKAQNVASSGRRFYSSLWWMGIVTVVSVAVILLIQGHERYAFLAAGTGVYGYLAGLVDGRRQQ